MIEYETLPSSSSISGGSVRQPLPKAEVFIVRNGRGGFLSSPSLQIPSIPNSPNSSSDAVGDRAQSSLPAMLRGRVRLLDIPRHQEDDERSWPPSPPSPVTPFASVTSTGQVSRSAPIDPEELSAPAAPPIQTENSRRSLLRSRMSKSGTLSMRSGKHGVVAKGKSPDAEQVCSIAASVASHYVYDDFVSRKKKKTLWRRFTSRVKGAAGSLYSAASPAPSPTPALRRRTRTYERHTTW